MSVVKLVFISLDIKEKSILNNYFVFNFKIG